MLISFSDFAEYLMWTMVFPLVTITLSLVSSRCISSYYENMVIKSDIGWREAFAHLEIYITFNSVLYIIECTIVPCLKLSIIHDENSAIVGFCYMFIFRTNIVYLHLN